MMRSSNLVFLSFCTLAAGFSFTGVPSTATVNEASSATLIRTDGDSTSFSLLLRFSQENGGHTIQTFQSEQETSIPFSFTPTQTGSFIIEVISNLQPISDNQEPDKIFATSSTINVVAASEDQSSPPTTTSSSSPEDTNSSSSSRNTDSASSTSASGSQNTAGGNNGNTVQGSSTISTSPAQTSSGSLSGSSSSTVSRTDSPVASITGSLSSASAGAQGALASTPGGGTSPSASNSGSSGSGGTTANPASTETSPGSTVTSAPTGDTSTSSKTGMIVGVVFGVLAFVAICLALLIAYTRYRRRKRTIAFERQLMFRPGGSSPLVFDNVTASHLTNSGGDGNHEYSPDSDMVERGRGEAQPVSVYSQQSVPSEYSDSPSVFYTAVPRAVGTSMSNNAPAPSTPPPNMPLPPVPVPTHGSAVGLQTGSIPSTSSSTPSFSAATSTPASAPPPLPQLAPGWVFPRNPDIRRSQLPPPKTDRQMDIYDRKVRLQGKLIGMQGWGNMHASDNEKSEMGMLKEQIRRLELLENSDWALGKSNELPPELSYS